MWGTFAAQLFDGAFGFGQGLGVANVGDATLIAQLDGEGLLAVGYHEGSLEFASEDDARVAVDE